MAVSMYGQVAIQASAPQEDPIKVGSLWVDTSGTATLKVCTSVSPYTFAEISGTDTGITQLTGDVTAGPGSGSQAATIAAVPAGLGTPVEQTTTATGSQNNFSLTNEYTFLRCNNASALTFSGFTNGGAAPTKNCVVIVENIGTSTVKITNQDTNSTAEHRVITASTNGQIVGAGGRMLAVYDTTTDRWRLTLVDPGQPIDVAHNSSNFTGSSSMTWTVEAADQTAFWYVQHGKTLTVALAVESSTVGGTTAGSLIVTTPGGFTTTHTVFSPSFHKDNGNFDTGAASPAAGGTTIRAFTRTLANWAASTNNTNLFFTVVFEVD